MSLTRKRRAKYISLKVYHSSLHTMPPYLAHKDPNMSKISPVSLSMSYNPYCHLHHHWNRRDPYWHEHQIYRLRLGDVLAIHRSKPSTGHDSCHCVPNIFRVPSQVSKSSISWIKGDVVHQGQATSQVRFLCAIMAVENQFPYAKWTR